MRDLRLAPTGERYKTLSADCFSCEISDSQRALFLWGGVYGFWGCVSIKTEAHHVVALWFWLIRWQILWEGDDI